MFTIDNEIISHSFIYYFNEKKHILFYAKISDINDMIEEGKIPCGFIAIPAPCMPECDAKKYLDKIFKIITREYRKNRNFDFFEEHDFYKEIFDIYKNFYPFIAKSISSLIELDVYEVLNGLRLCQNFQYVIYINCINDLKFVGNEILEICHEYINKIYEKYNDAVDDFYDELDNSRDKILSYLNSKYRRHALLTGLYNYLYKFSCQISSDVHPCEIDEDIIRISSIISGKIKNNWMGQSAYHMKLADGEGKNIFGIINSSINEIEPFIQDIKRENADEKGNAKFEYGDIEWLGGNIPEPDRIREIMSLMPESYEFPDMQILWMAYIKKGRMCIRYMIPFVNRAMKKEMNEKETRKWKIWMHCAFKRKVRENFADKDIS